MRQRFNLGLTLGNMLSAGLGGNNLRQRGMMDGQRMNALQSQANLNDIKAQQAQQELDASNPSTLLANELKARGYNKPDQIDDAKSWMDGSYEAPTVPLAFKNGGESLPTPEHIQNMPEIVKQLNKIGQMKALGDSNYTHLAESDKINQRNVITRNLAEATPEEAAQIGIKTSAFDGNNPLQAYQAVGVDRILRPGATIADKENALLAQGKTRYDNTGNVGAIDMLTGTQTINGVGDSVIAENNAAALDEQASAAKNYANIDKINAEIAQMNNPAPDKAPSGYRFTANGDLEAIPGGPADNKGGGQKLTEQQGKAFMFGQRADAANNIINELEGQYSPLAVNAKEGAANIWGVGGALEPIANAMLSKEAQRAEQAQRDFINAILRQESGAVISDQEFDNAKKQYFPQPGDTQAVLDQKRRNRELAIDGLSTVSNNTFTRSNPQQINGATGSWGDEGKTVVRTGTANGRRVVQYSDGTIEYAN